MSTRNGYLRPRAIAALCFLVSLGYSHLITVADEPLKSLPGTAELTIQGDIASQLVDGVDRFLMRKLAESPAARAEAWKTDTANTQQSDTEMKGRRERLSHMLGIRSNALATGDIDFQISSVESGELAQSDRFRVFAVRWPVLSDPDPNRSQTVFHADGLLLVPTTGRPPVAYAVALPDSADSPESISGLDDRIPKECQFAKSLAEAGCMVLVPTLVNRELVQRNGRSTISNREYLYRSAFELGRHIIGYEIQSVMRAVSLLAEDRQTRNAPIVVAGYGDGGMLALYSAALDDRISGAFVSGYFDQRERIWQQPLDRNVFGLLNEFGDAELGRMIAPRKLWIDCTAGPELNLPGQGGAPAALEALKPATVRAEIERCRALAAKNSKGEEWLSASNLDAEMLPTQFCKSENITKFLQQVGIEPASAQGNAEVKLIGGVDAKTRMQERVDEMDLYTQLVLRESVFERDQFMKPLYDAASSGDISKYNTEASRYRGIYAKDIIGQFSDELLPATPRTRLAYDEPKWTGYEVVLDVWPDVIAYGILLLPKDLKPGERRPVVVCQHGLEGRPQDLVQGDNKAYHDYAAKLAERGFITFAPQNLYLFKDRFRVLQRKANPLGKTLFSFIVPQHQQIVNWLKDLPMVDPSRIAFYGLSYGGKSAMRIPPLVTDYCLSICSADFNEWVDKNASTRNPYSYASMNEYEIFEFDLGSRFNYAEMATLIAPRPFMVERGHHDMVAADETVAHEFARVRYHYEARLKRPLAEIEFFDGPHTINGQGTFRFLHQHLNWPAP